MVVIRLARMGKTHKPFYRITVADSRAAATGKFLEQIGHYDPNLNPPDIKVNHDAALKWLKNGAQPSDTVRALFYRQGLMEQSTNARTGKAASDLKARESYQAKKPKVHKKAKEKAEANAKAAAAAKAAEEKAAADAKVAAEAAAAEAKAAAESAAAAAAEAPAAEAAAEEAPAA